MIFEKIRERLEEEKQRLRKLKNDTITLFDSEVIAIEEQSYNFCKEIVNQVEAEYNNGWIDIKTKLPKYDEYVLCQGKNSQFIACIDGLDNKWKDGHFYVRTNITHWQPLPQPPKGE